MLLNISQAVACTTQTINMYVWANAIILKNNKKNFKKKFSYFLYLKVREIYTLKQEKECLMDELHKTQDTLSRLKHEKSIRSIDTYDPHSPEILQKKIS